MKERYKKLSAGFVKQSGGKTICAFNVCLCYFWLSNWKNDRKHIIDSYGFVHGGNTRETPKSLGPIRGICEGPLEKILYRQIKCFCVFCLQHKQFS